jgi:hypothetical protein
VDNQQKQHLIDLPKLIAGAVASPSAALLTSRFGVAGTLVGLALSAVIVTVISDFIKVYLQRIPGTVTRIEGGFTKKPRWQRPFHRLRHPFSKFSSLAPAQRRSILIRSVIAGVIMFIVGLVVVTGLELSVRKDLSCWVWNNCPKEASTETSASGSSASNTTTLPSIFGGGRSIGSNPLQVVAPLPVQQQPTPPPGSQGPLTQPSLPVSGQPSSSSSSQKQSPPSTEYQQQSGYELTTESQQQGEYQQQSSYEQTTESPQQNEYQQQSANQQQTNSEQTTEYPQQQGEYQQQNLPSNPGNQQQNLPSNPRSQQQNLSNSSNSVQQKGSQQAVTPSPSVT